ETKEEYEFLKNLGCDMVQGYLFSKPVSDEGLSELFASGKLIKN
ncbi:MAG: EAL domain-containing protein, partial [Lachnospiraceae bacterium]|nr:EAL domain-containing protein [Lachnospiraceae bacterium]